MNGLRNICEDFMIEKYLDEIKDIIKEKKICIFKEFYYVIQISNNFFKIGSANLEKFESFNVADINNFFNIYKSDKFSIYIYHGTLLTDDNVVFSSERKDVFSDFIHKNGVTFSVDCENCFVLEYIQSRFKNHENFKSLDDIKNKTFKKLKCYTYIGYVGFVEFYLYYNSKTPNKVRITLSSDGGFYIGKYSDKLKNLSVDKHYSEIHYGQQFFKELKKFNINISQAVKKNNKRFYERFEKYLT